jgi:hypothetical protein
MAMVGTDRLLRAVILRRWNRIRISFGEPVTSDETTRSRYTAGDREAARRLVRDRLWPRVSEQVVALRSKQGAAGGGLLLALVGVILLRRRRNP